MTNEVVRLIQSHRSVRKYTQQAIDDGVLREILIAAQWAPSSHNVQAYSIIVVRDSKTRIQLSQMCAFQDWVAECPVFLVFCADFYRNQLACQMHQKDFQLGEVENLLVGAVDTALAAQNALLAARSFGLGGVMIGGIRNNPEQVAQLLHLPPYTLPIVGLCIGYPADIPGQKPRLPLRAVVHEESYDVSQLSEALQEYERISSEYYFKRTKGRRTEGWTKQMADYFSGSRRPHLRQFILKQGIGLQ